MDTFRIPASKLSLFKQLCYLVVDRASADKARGLSLLNPFSVALGHRDFASLQQDAKKYGEGPFDWNDFYQRLLVSGPEVLSIPGSKFGPLLFDACLEAERTNHDFVRVALGRSIYNRPWRNESAPLRLPDGLVSCDGPTARDLQEKARAETKNSNLTYQEALYRKVVEERGAKVDEVYSALFLPAKNNEVHRIVVGKFVLILWAHNEYLYLDSYHQASKPTRSLGYSSGQVVYGDVTALEFLERKTDNESYRPQKEGWWLCKYEGTQPRICLSSLSSEQALWIEQFMAIGAKSVQMYNAPVFKSVIEWVSRHPQKAACGSNTYYTDWGPEALKRLNGMT